jgi:putative sigma-54 modulation protein
MNEVKVSLNFQCAIINYFEARFMKLKISFKHLKHTPALDERIKEKSEKLDKYFEGNTNVSWVCWVHGDEHWAEIKVHGPKFDFFAKAYADNMYKSLDLCIEKMERQFEKKKDIYKNKIHGAPTPKYREIEALVSDETEYQEKLNEEKSA